MKKEDNDITAVTSKHFRFHRSNFGNVLYGANNSAARELKEYQSGLTGFADVSIE